MAIYHSHVKIIGRSPNRSSRSAVASSAYRAGEKIKNDYDGIEHDYTRKGGIVHKEIMTPENAPEWMKDRSTLWNEVEKIEKRKDSQLAREVEVGLPKELTLKENIELVRDYVKECYTDRGMVADVSIHDKGDGNPHAHIMLTMRNIEGDKFGNKNRDWNDRELYVSTREAWAERINERYAQKGINERVDHRSYEEQGVEKIPTVHMGKYATKIEKKGGKSIMGDINREIQAQNKRLELLKVELAKLEEEIKYQAAEYEEALKQEEARLAEEAKVEEEKRTEETKKTEERRKAEEAKKAEQIKQQQQVKLNQQQQPIEQPEENKQWKSSADNTRIPGLYSINDQAKMRLAIAYGQDYQKSQEIKENTNAEIAAIKNRLKDLEQRKEELDKINKQIADKEQQKKQLGLFGGREKKQLEKEIADLEKRKQAKIESLQKDRGLKPNEIDKAISDNKKSLDAARALHKQAEKQGKSLSDLMREAKVKTQQQERTQNRNHDKGRER